MVKGKGEAIAGASNVKRLALLALEISKVPGAVGDGVIPGTNELSQERVRLKIIFGKRVLMSI